VIEQALRDMFTRHEEDAPAPVDVREAIAVGFRRRRRRRKVWRGSGLAVAVLAVLAAIPVVINVADAGAQDRQVHQMLAAPTASRSPTPTNYLLIGADSVTASPSARAAKEFPTPAAKAPSDSLILVHLTADRNSLYLINLSGLSRVTIPGRGPGMLENAYLLGGLDLARRTVEGYTGVDLAGAAQFSMAVLSTSVEAVGGIDLEIDEQAYATVRGDRLLTPGYQHLNGLEAVEFAQQRTTIQDGQDGQERHLRQVLVAFIEKSRTEDPGLLSKLQTIAATVVTTGAGEVDLTGLATTLSEVRSVLGASVYVKSEPDMSKNLFAALAADKVGNWLQANPQN
jgi:LCP family protein required for cell wall assembly